MNYLKMKKTIAILTLLMASLMPFAAKAQTAPPGDWRLHNTYHCMDKSFGFDKKIIDTPDKVYILSLGLPYFSWSSSYSTEYPLLFVYDKKNNEIEGYNAKNYLHGNIINNMWYNASKKYFLIVYDDYNIDILYTDDRCYNVPGLASAIIPNGKNINSVTFDPENNHAYVATTFGYMVIDDNKNVISESHLYGTCINSIARIGDNLIAGTNDGMYISDAKRNDLHNTWNTFRKIASAPRTINNILALTGNNFLYIDGTNHLFKGMIDVDGNVVLDGKDISGTNVTRFNETREGYFMNTGWEGLLIDKTGNIQNLSGTSSFRNETYGASSTDEIWKTAAPKGITRLMYDGSQWINNPLPGFGEFILSNSPAVFDGDITGYSTEYGMILSNSCYAHFHGSTELDYDMIISKYKNGNWSNIVSGSDIPGGSFMVNSHPATLEPDKNIVWAGSATASLIKYDMETNKGSKFGPSGRNTNCQTPKFSVDGTLWSVQGSSSNLIFWKKEDRDKEDASKLKTIPVAGFTAGSFPIIQPCNSQGASNFIVMASGQYDSNWTVLDHNGTPDNTSDDRVIHLSNPVDQDGQPISINYTYCMAEDPETGRIWVGGDGGLFWFNPAEVFNPNFHVNRVKVARNDGTGLADYLLEGASVFCIGIDGAGHKWFGTLGNGIVETSASGSEIIRQLTRENSYLPCNDVISVGFEPNSNCVWIGTKQGVAQYYSETMAGADKLDDVLAYPNPVRPDYYGQVTIKGLMDGTLVKILDASGGLVHELGRSEGGMMLWDLTNMGGRRVPTGVYYVATSTSGDSSEANVAKILVMN